MLELITKYWSEILSVVGAAAWLPVIFPPIINHFRRIQSTVFLTIDYLQMDGHFLLLVTI